MKLIDKILKFFKTTSYGCSKSDCYQGRNCSCGPISFGEVIIEVHTLATKVDDTDISFELRQVANRLAKLGNQYHEKHSNDQ